MRTSNSSGILVSDEIVTSIIFSFLFDKGTFHYKNSLCSILKGDKLVEDLNLLTYRFSMELKCAIRAERKWLIDL